MRDLQLFYEYFLLVYLRAHLLSVEETNLLKFPGDSSLDCCFFTIYLFNWFIEISTVYGKVENKRIDVHGTFLIFDIVLEKMGKTK